MSRDELLGDRFERALIYATRLHREQRRKGSGTPYAAHLLGVASLVLEDGGSEDEAIAALLHDAAEDQGGRAQLDEIEREFGSRVAHIVEAVPTPTSVRNRLGDHARRRTFKRLPHTMRPCVVSP